MRGDSASKVNLHTGAAVHDRSMHAAGPFPPPLQSDHAWEVASSRPSFLHQGSHLLGATQPLSPRLSFSIPASSQCEGAADPSDGPGAESGRFSGGEQSTQWLPPHSPCLRQVNRHATYPPGCPPALYAHLPTTLPACLVANGNPVLAHPKVHQQQQGPAMERAGWGRSCQAYPSFATGCPSHMTWTKARSR